MYAQCQPKGVRLLSLASLGDDMNKYMGLDLSLTSSGVAVLNTLHTSKGEFETIERNLIKSNKRGVHRLQELSNKIVRELERHNPAGVAIEGYAMGKGGSGSNSGRVFDIGEWGGIVRLTLLNRNIPTILVPPKTLKMFVALNGNADKELMTQSLKDRFSILERQNDKADAVGLSIMAQAFFEGLDYTLHKKEQQAVDNCQQIIWSEISKVRTRTRVKL